MKERRGSKEGLKGEEILDRLNEKARYAIGEKKDRRKSKVTKKTTAETQASAAETQGNKTNKSKAKRTSWNDQQKEKILSVILKNNYEKKLTWEEYSDQVRDALGRKRNVSKDKLVRVSNAIVKAVGNVEGSLLNVPAYSSKTIIKNAALAQIAALGKKKRL